MFKTIANHLKNGATNCIETCENMKKLQGDKENLQAQMNVLIEENKRIKTELVEKDVKIEALTGSFRKFVLEKFGSSTEQWERLNPINTNIDEAEKQEDNKDVMEESSEATGAEVDVPAEEKAKIKPKKPRKAHPHGRVIPENLPEVVVYHRLTDEELLCPITGKLLYRETTLTEDSIEIDIEIKMVKIIHKRVVYAKIGADTVEDTSPAMLVAKKTESIINKSLYSTRLWTLLLVMKFFAQIPIHRQINNVWGQYGTYFNPSTITGGFKKLGEYLVPLYEEFTKESRKATHWHADETRWKVFVEHPGKKTTNWWMWVFASSKVFVYVLDKTRSSKVPKEHFGENASGIINVDRYAGYLVLVGKMLRALCWYHMRRDFIKAFISFPELKEWANDWRIRIRLLEKINDVRVACIGDLEKFNKQQQLLENQLSEMKTTCNNEFKDASLKDAQIKVLKSLLKNWDGLTVFVSNPLVPMHNNFAERALRLLALGRKNFYGSRSEWSGQLAAMCMSICKTAELHGLNPQAYIEFYFNRCTENPSREPKDITSLLPWNLSTEVIDMYNLRSRGSTVKISA